MFREAIENYYEDSKAIREDIHRHPELSYKEVRTCALIMDKLKEYGCDEIQQVWNTGVVALIKGGLGEGKCLAIRADTDALPIIEDTGVEFTSENPGVMHACGHDIHTAALLLTARVLCENRDKFKGCVKLIFQPAEESGNPSNTDGGAKPMIWAGCMENPKVDAIIAMHVDPSDVEKPTFAVKHGVITSGFDVYRFDVHGKTAHGSQPQLGNDAILAISQFITLLQQVVSRNINPQSTAILTVGTITGGSAINIIPDSASAGGVFRYYDNVTADEIYKNTMNIAKGVELASGCKIDVKTLKGYACVDNDDALVDLVVDTLGAENVIMLSEPATGSEDFSAFSLLTGCPCCFMWLKTPSVIDGIYPLHSSKCVLSSEALKTAADGFTSIALSYLNN